MEIEFNSRIYIRNKKKFRGLMMLVLVICIVLIMCMLLKGLVGDFSGSDLGAMCGALLVIFVAINNRREEPQYANAYGKICFGEEEFVITYKNVNGGKGLGFFDEEIEIKYEELEVIEYGKALNCFRIVAKCLRKRDFLDFRKEKVLEKGERPTEVFVYVYDEDVADEIRKKLQRATSSIIKILED